MPDFVGVEGTSIKVRPHPLFGGFGPGVALALLARPTRPKIDLFFENREAQSRILRLLGGAHWGCAGRLPGRRGRPKVRPHPWFGAAEPRCVVVALGLEGF